MDTARRLAEKNFALADALAEQGNREAADRHWQQGAFWAAQATTTAIRSSR